MNAKRSPVTGRKRHTNFQSPRPYSVYAGTQYLKASGNADSWRGSRNLSKMSSLNEDTSAQATSQNTKNGK